MAFQTDVINDDQWKQEIDSTQNTLQVIEVYQKWSGPSKAMHNTMKKIYFEFGDRAIKFYTAEASGIQQLNQFDNQCEPKVLLQWNGQIIDDVTGVDASQMQDKIEKYLANPPE